jgi:hypothetical protein
MTKDDFREITGFTVVTEYYPPPIGDWRKVCWHASVDGQEEWGQESAPSEEAAIQGLHDMLCTRDDLLDAYGNFEGANVLVNCCFPDCGCDGARLCSARSGANAGACALNIEQRSAAARGE